ncbi:MAG TPA: fluoride efflux transporter CrcB [Armatimonadota bacterium]|nr:fluoride efflux transporter CrcB [Armatimonadota bacterium]
MVAAGGALGAPARKLVGQWAGQWVPVPYSTFIINVTGSLLLGLTLGVLSDRLPRSRVWRLGIAIGFLGAYTTFSSFEYDALRLIQTGHPWQAVAYLTSSVCAGFAAIWVGNLVGHRL